MEILRVDGLKFSYTNKLKKPLNNINYLVQASHVCLKSE